MHIEDMISYMISKMIAFHNNTDQYINTAIELYSVHIDILTLPEFIKAVNYPIDMFMIDRFWNTMENNMLIYVDNELIKWMGYEGETRVQKQSFLRSLSGAKSGEDYFQYSNAEYENFLTKTVQLVSCTEIYPKIDRMNGKNMTKHLLLTSKCLKTTMMKENTARGD